MRTWFFAFVLFLAALSCGKTGNRDFPGSETPPIVLNSTIADGAEGVPVAAGFIDIGFDTPIRVKDASRISMSGARLSVTGMNLKIRVAYEALEYSRSYVLVISEGAVVSQDSEIPIKEYRIAFMTEARPDPQPDPDPDPDPDPEDPPFFPENPGIYSKEPVTDKPLHNARRLYKYLLSVYGKKTLSGAMAKVAWNTFEADWVKKWTGKYPAIATFDYIHLKNSPCNWIDYSDISALENWFSNGGIIGACWHWKVPAYENAGLDTYTFNAGKTSFKVSNIFIEGTWEKKTADADLEKIASYLKLLQNKKIPVLWRPLHEAAGNTYTEYHSGAWFWWGKEGGEQYVKLWRYMFDFFKSKGINNLIWIWTTQTSSLSDSDYAFYPGDEFVDIVGRDLYNVGNAVNIGSQFSVIASMFPKKMTALSENGGVPDMQAQWEAGAKWLFFMPWYDYNNDGSAGYAHEHANISWWNKSLNFSSVISRDDLPKELYK